jgi:predicted hydrocarbon binding protein
MAKAKANAHTKGTTLIDLVKFLRTRRDDARALLPAPLHHYLDEHISVAAWYPEEEAIELIRVLAKLMPGSREEALAQIGRLNARIHLEGTYAHLLAGARLSTLPVRAVALWRSMHDTGDLRLQVEDDHADARLSGYGHPTPEMCIIIGTYVCEAFELAGARDAKVDERACCRAGAPACEWRIAWTPGAETAHG